MYRWPRPIRLAKERDCKNKFENPLLDQADASVSFMQLDECLLPTPSGNLHSRLVDATCMRNNAVQCGAGEDITILMLLLSSSTLKCMCQL